MEDAPGSTDDNKDSFLFLLQANLTHLPRSAYVPGIGSGMGKCPYDPLDNSTAIYVEEGNPGNLPALVRITAFSGRRTAALDDTALLGCGFMKYSIKC